MIIYKFVLVISGFRRKIAGNCALLGYYTTSCGNLLPTFRDDLSVQCSGFKNSSTLRTGLIDCLETSVRN